VVSIDADGLDREGFVVLITNIVGRTTVVAHHTKHVVTIRLIAREGADVAGHLGGCSIGFTGEDGSKGTADSKTFRRIIGNAHDHEHGAKVGIAKTQGAEVV
jgi:hypothetical protein